MTEMPFGKYKGEDILKVPTYYFIMALEAEWLDKPYYTNLKSKILVELKKRLENLDLIDHYSSKATNNTQEKSDRPKLQTVYRKLAMKYHPDKSGGSSLGMQALNDFYE